MKERIIQNIKVFPTHFIKVLQPLDRFQGSAYIHTILIITEVSPFFFYKKRIKSFWSNYDNHDHHLIDDVLKNINEKKNDFLYKLCV